ncbi:MAG: polysaccharide deacetylase family protein [Chitinophagaceae bacterium]
MKRLSFLFINLLFPCFLIIAQPTTQEKLGYSKDTKLLIIHGDDLGVSHSENEATINAMEKGSVSSASIMVPTPWFSEIAAYAAAHPKSDFGLHLTLTSEWKYYKWGPTADGVPGLTNSAGFFPASVDSIYKSAKIEEVEKEIRMQIDKAKQFGIDVTHLDSHMGTLFGNKGYLKLLIKLSREYKVPAMLIKTGPNAVFGMDIGDVFSDKDVFVDAIHSAGPDNFKNSMANYYSGVISSMKPGLNVFIIHVAYDDKEMQGVTVDHPDWGAAWRQADYNFFSSDACKELLKKNNIKVITWREVRDKLMR